MFRKTFFVLFCFLIALSFGCGSSETSENANKSVNLSVDPANLPPEFSSSPINTNGASTPGIPDPNNANVVQKGTTPTPGIPDPATIGKTPMPKGTPPIPGIPSEEELKKQLNTPRNAEDVNKVPPGDPISNTGAKPIDRKRTVSNQQ